MIVPNPSVSTRPRQVIPEAEKTLEWAVRNMDWSISMTAFNQGNKEDRLYNTYNGIRDHDKFKSITATYGIEFPGGKLKHIPLVKPLLSRLAGQQQDRPWGTIVRSADTDAVDIKKQDIANGILNDIIEGIKSQDTTSMDVFLDKTQKYYGEDFQADFEIGAAHILEDYRLKHDLEQKLWDCFIDKEVTGRQYYYCRVNRLGENPEFKDVRPTSLWYSDDNVKWVRQCERAVHAVKMTPSEIIDRWGEKLSPEELKKIDDWADVYSRDSYKIYDQHDMDRILYGSDADNLRQRSNYFEKITVYFVEWKSERKVDLMNSPNKYDEEYPWLKYVPQDKLEEFRGKRKKNLEKRYVQDLYQGVRIGDDIYTDVGKVRYPRRDALMPSRVHLSFNGLTFNGKIKPYSLVEVTEDLQDLYDIMHYHKENLIAMSGTKGSYMDLSQLPDFGTGDFKQNLKMYLYYKKLGSAFIDRSKDTADNNFNQFPSYDDTLDASLSVVLEMIRHIEETAQRIVGVNRQQMGDISSYDGDATTKSAIQNSALTTVPFFNEHDEFTRMACEDIVNACKVTYPYGTQGSYVNNQFVQTIFNVSPEFSAHDYNVYFTNRMSDQQSISEVRAWAYKMLDSQMIQFEDILPLFRKTSLRDIELTVKKGIEMRRKAMEENNKQIQAIQQQLSVATAQGEIQKLGAQVTELTAKAKRMEDETRLEEMALSMEGDLENKKIDNDNRRVGLEAKQIDVAGQQKSRGNSAEVKNK